mmetsp:Transcript_46410/g.122595  ORF Transcript_46410/g.122595 Transcript_46410/m.122595 type:complete len:479 (-) Transcript_46410:225-1661(-)
MKTRASLTAMSATAPSSQCFYAAPEQDGKKRDNSLALRRKFGRQGLTVLNVDTAPSREYKRIQRRESVKAFYALGRQVMPSCHRGMEIVFAKSVATGKEVVVKIRHKDQSFSGEGSESEWRESTEFVMNLPSCNGIAQIYEVLEDDKGYYVVMEKVVGHDLFEILRMQGLLPMAEVREVLRQLLTAVGVMHEKGAIHKDLKLENVMFVRSPTDLKGCGLPCSPTNPNGCSSLPSSPFCVKLIDFDTVEEHLPATPKTAKDVMGTDQYIAQEAYSGQYGFASDIFAVGVIGYKLMTGEFPFRKDLFNDEAGENYVGHPKMKEIRNKLREFKIDWSHKNFVKEPEGLALMRGMLAVSDRHRPSAEEALAHAFLAIVSSRVPGTQLPKCSSSAELRKLPSTTPSSSSLTLPRASSSSCLTRPSTPSRRSRTETATPVKVVKAPETLKSLVSLSLEKRELRRESVTDRTMRLARGRSEGSLS